MNGQPRAFGQGGAPLADLPFLDLYIRIDDSVTSATPTEYQEDDDASAKAVPSGYQADVEALRAKLRHMKSTSGLSAAGFRVFHDGVRYRGSVVETISADPEIEFEQVVCLRRFKQTPPNVDKLKGWDPADRNWLKSLGDETGILIIAGGTGSGKTTTGIGLVRSYSITAPGVTYMVEDPCEYILNGPDPDSHGRSRYFQREVTDDSQWAPYLRDALRFHPRRIYIGEIRSPEVAAQAIMLGMSGHLVILTLHSSSCANAVSTLIQRASASPTLGEDLARHSIADALLAVVYQERKDGKFKMDILEGGARTGAEREYIRKGEMKQLDGAIEGQKARRKKTNGMSRLSDLADAGRPRPEQGAAAPRPRPQPHPPHQSPQRNRPPASKSPRKKWGLF